MIEGPYPIPPSDAAEVQRRLCEARAWCLHKFQPDDPRNSLRSAELKPQRPFTIEHTAPNGRSTYDHLTTDTRIALVNDVSHRRAALIAKLGLKCPDWSAAGDCELLAVEIDYSLSEGLPEHESDGFVDVSDIPAWDTWLHLQRIGNTDVLLCWIPSALVERVNNAIYASCTACLGWVDSVLLSRPKWETRRWF